MNIKYLQLAKQKRSARIHLNIYADMNLIMLNISLFYSYHSTIYLIFEDDYQYLLYYTSNKNSILKKLIQF